MRSIFLNLIVAVALQPRKANGILRSSSVAQSDDIVEEDITWFSRMAQDISSFNSLPPTAAPTIRPTFAPSEGPTHIPSKFPSSLPSPIPSAVPSKHPSEVPTTVPSTAPSAIPSAVPSDIPSIVPTFVPSTTPTGAPTSVPSLLPSDAPSTSPTTNPTLSPSVSASFSPSTSPSIMPSQAPSNLPTNSPTGQCIATVSLDCKYTMSGNNSESPCEDLSPINESFCTCSECVRQIAFTFTGSPCNGRDGCIDSETAVRSPSYIAFSPCDSDDYTYETFVEIGDMLTLSLGDACLPECLDVVILDPVSGNETQMITVDTSCEGNDLALKESYGAIDFMGYSCDEDDEQNCLQELVYNVEACNEGSDNLTLYEFFFMFNEETEDLLENGVGPVLMSGECVTVAISEVADRCSAAEYGAMAVANATELDDGPVCEADDALKFSIVPITQPPTSAPSEPPTPLSCNLDIDVEPACPTIECGWDRCRERPFRMEFRVDTRLCKDSILKRCPGQDPDSCTCIRNVTLMDDEWSEQKFECTDFNGGPKDASATYYITASPEKDDGVIYFEGTVAGTSGVFNATDPDLDRVEANMYLRLYEYNSALEAPGDLLQEVLFHSSCSQQLYLLDIFGSFQLIEFQSESQLVGFGVNPEIAFGMNLDLEGSTLNLDFLSLAVLPDQAGLILPQILEFDVSGISMPPAYNASAGVTLIPDQDFIVISTVAGTLDGKACFDISQSKINCPGIVEPDVRA